MGSLQSLMARTVRRGRARSVARGAAWLTVV